MERSQESRHTQHRSEGLNMDARGPQHGCAAAHMKGRPGSGMCARRVHVLVTLVACALSALTSPWRLWAAAGLLHAETTAQVLMRRSRPALCAGGRRSFPTRPVHCVPRRVRREGQRSHVARPHRHRRALRGSQRGGSSRARPHSTQIRVRCRVTRSRPCQQLQLLFAHVVSCWTTYMRTAMKRTAWPSVPPKTSMLC